MVFIFNVCQKFDVHHIKTRANTCAHYMLILNYRYARARRVYTRTKRAKLVKNLDFMIKVPQPILHAIHWEYIHTFAIFTGKRKLIIYIKCLCE